MLTLHGENENGDATLVQYRFRVDRSGPAVLLSAPVNGAFFGGSDNDYTQETVYVIGRSEPGTTIVVELEGVKAIALNKKIIYFYNLTGGVLAWQNAISAEKVLFSDTTFPTPTVKPTEPGSLTFVR